MRKHYRAKSSSCVAMGVFAYFENGHHRIVPVFNKLEMHHKLLELDDRMPWSVERYEYVELRR
jgi:hypothetical protein